MTETGPALERSFEQPCAHPAHPAHPARAAHLARAERAAYPARAERAAYPARPERAAYPARPERAADPARPERAADPARAERAADPARAADPTRTARAAHPAHPARPGRRLFPPRLLAILALLCAGLLAPPLSVPEVRAATPPDTLVMGLAIDDIISLDPAETFEFTGAEYVTNTYDRLVAFDPRTPDRLTGQAAESWTLSPDGRTYRFRLRPGQRFASGQPLTAADAAFSLQRAIRLQKTPAAILSQFGWTPENVEARIRAPDDLTLELETERALAPDVLLNCLTATVGSILDRRTVLEHERDGDLGHAWLRTAHAGSGPFKLRQWRANEHLILERHEDYREGAPALRRVIVRHLPEPATQRLLLARGDLDLARNLGPEQLAGLSDTPGIRIRRVPKLNIHYVALNQRHPVLARPEVRQALKYLVDYAGLAHALARDQARVHQAFLPVGLAGALEETPFALDPERARALLREAGIGEAGFGFALDTPNGSLSLQIAQSLQSTLAQAGIRLEIRPGDNKQILTRYRARAHDAVLMRWGADYRDPHANAEAFASNPDNADTALVKTLAWRNAWETPALNERVQAALAETDPARRVERYRELQRDHQQDSPFVILFQEIEAIAERTQVEGFMLTPGFGDVRYAGVRKLAEGTAPRP